MFFVNRWILLSVTLAVMSVACAADNSGDEEYNSQYDTLLNPDLNGRLFFSYQESAYTMDLRSGEYTLVPNSDWEQQDLRFPLGISRFSALAFGFDDRFLLTVDSCEPIEGSINDYFTCILVQDFSGNYIEQLNIRYNLYGAAKASIDGGYIALFRELNSNWLEIYNFSGELVSDVIANPSAFSWMPDGSLVYIIENRTFVLTQPYSTDTQTSITLANSVDQGNIHRLAVSPDGTKIAFSIFSAGTLVSEYTSFWMLDLGSNQVRKIAVSDPGDTLDDAFHQFAWSPDGQQIAVLEGGVTGNSSLNSGVPANLYVLPSNSEDILVVSSDSSIRSTEVVLVQSYRFLNRAPSANSVRDYFFDVDFSWLSY